MSLFEEKLRDFDSIGPGQLSDLRTQIAEQVESPEKRFWWFWAQGEAYRRQRNWSRAMEWFQSAADTLDEWNSGRVAGAELYGGIGLVRHEVGDTGDAVDYLYTSTRYWEEIADSLGAANEDGNPLIQQILGQLAALLHEKEPPLLDDRARVEVMQAWLQDRFLVGQAKIQLAFFQALGRAAGYDEVREPADRWIDCLERSVAPPSRGWFLQSLHTTLGNIAQNSKQFDKAVDHFDRALEWVEPVDHQRQLERLRLEFNRCNARAQAGCYDEAVAEFARLETAFEELGDETARVRCEHARLFLAQKQGDATVEGAMRANIAEQERAIGETHDPTNLHVLKENLERGYTALISMLADPGDRDPEVRLRDVLRLVAAMREPTRIAHLSDIDERSRAEEIESIDTIQERLRHLPDAVLLVLESSVDGLLWVALRGGDEPLERRLAIEKGDAENVDAVTRLLIRATDESDAVSAGAISPYGRDSESLVDAAKKAWSSLPTSIRSLVSAAGAILYAPSAFGSIDEIPLELLCTDEDWLAQSHVITRYPRVSTLERALSPNAVPRSLGSRAMVIRAQDPEGLGKLTKGDSDARQIEAAFNRAFGWESQLEFCPSAATLLRGLMGEHRVVHYVGHGMASDLGENLPLGDESITVRSLECLIDHRTPFVYLSACLVGRARHLQGGKQKGIGLELLDRGAPAVVAASFSVPDEVCNPIAMAFYRFARHHPVGEAMRLARRRLAETDKMRAVCWSAFSLHGDPKFRLTSEPESVEDSRIATLDAPALLTRWMATGSDSDREACLKAWDASRASSAEVLDWLRESPNPHLPESARQELADQLAEKAPVHAAALRMLLARDRITTGSLSSPSDGDGADRRRKEIGLAIGLALKLDDDWGFAAFCDDYCSHCVGAVDLGESIKVLGHAETVLTGLSERDERLGEVLESVRVELKPLRDAPYVLDARRMLGLSHEEFQAVEEAPGSDPAKTAYLKVMAKQGARGRAARPWWDTMLRYVGANNEESFADLAASVAEDAPTGGVSPAEAALVRKVLVSHQGPGVIDEEPLEALRQHVADRAAALNALEVFEIYDRIADEPEDVDECDVADGMEIADELGHPGLQAYFLSLQAQTEYPIGNIASAAEMILDCIDLLEELTDEDGVYHDNLKKCRHNGAVFTALDGDFETGRQLAATLDDPYRTMLQQSIPALFDEPPDFPEDAELLVEEASRLLEADFTVEALEWYVEAEQRAKTIDAGEQLCFILGDLAVAFRRVGNLQRACHVYDEAVEMCQSHGDDRNLSAWSSNFGNLLLQAGEVESAESLFRMSNDAARRCGDPEKIALAQNDLAQFLQESERFEEASEAIAEALELAHGDEWLTKLLKDNAARNQAYWGESLFAIDAIEDAAECFERALDLFDTHDEEEMGLAVDVAMRLAVCREALSDREGFRRAINTALELARRLGDDELVARLRTLST